MRGKVEFFKQLPDEPIQAAAAAVAPGYSPFVRGCTMGLHPAKLLLSQFLQHVVKGEYAKVQEMLRNNIHLLYYKGAVKDPSGREFDSISGFEYALWALDKHQWDDMLACLPRDESGGLTRQGQQVLKHLLAQYSQVRDSGVTYRFKGETKTESHYDFAIVDVLQQQVDATYTHGIKDWPAIGRQWCEGVGGAQRLLPAHVVDEYCSDKPFYPVLQFATRATLTSRGRKFYNAQAEKWDSWYDERSGLGVDIAIYQFGKGCIGRKVWPGGARRELDALKVLHEVRALDFNELKVQLESLNGVEEQSRLIPA